VISVADTAPLETVVATMERARIKRVPVTRDGHVTGVVSRADLLRALVSRVKETGPVTQDDSDIRTAILDDLERQAWAPMTTLNVTVSQGVADIWGTITNEEERHAIRVLVENTPGVAAVQDHLVYIEPYTGTVIEGPGETP
jgi:CBS domain-containing protein